MTLRRVPVAVVGAGWWATDHHLPGLTTYEGADVVAVVDPDETKRRAAADEFGVGRHYPSVADLLEAGVAEAAVVATPSATHHRVARELLAGGVHVMCEKPFTIDPAHAAELTRMSEERGLVLTVGYTFQHTVAARRLHDVVRSGGLGEIISMSGLFASMVEAYYRGDPQTYKGIFEFRLTGPGTATYSDPANAGGGQGQTQVTHAAGMQFHVTGGRATRVYAEMEQRDLAVDLVDAIAFRLDGGAVATMASTGNLRPGDPAQQEFRYYGTEGFALHDLVTGELAVRYADGREEALTGDAAGDPYPSHAPGRHLTDLVDGRTTQNVAPPREATRVVEFLDAAYRSAGSHAMVEPVDGLGG